MSYKPTIFTPIEIVDKIHEISIPLQKTLKTLAENPNASMLLRQNALHNYRSVEDLHNAAENIAHQYNEMLSSLSHRLKC